MQSLNIFLTVIITTITTILRFTLKELPQETMQ